MTTLTAVEKLALELPESQRATLALHMLDSLPGLFAESDEGIAEATRRDAEMDADSGIAVSMDDFDRMIADRRAT
ncbi:MAG: hypothetical protein WCC08_21140 [Terrimicrobiaceae bacterium]